MAKTDGETVRPATPSDDRDEPTATGDREVSATAADLDEQTPAADDAEAPDDADDDAEARDDGEDDAPRRRIRLGGGRAPTGAVRRVLSVVLVVALLAGVVATVVFGARWYRQRQIDEAHDQALAAARQECVNFVSISASSVDSDLQRILSGATGQFKDEFTRSMPQVRSAVMENNVESKGSALAAALVTGDRDSATVLVAVDATVKNTHAEDGRLSHYRIQVDLARDSRSGKWLVSKLQFVG